MKRIKMMFMAMVAVLAIGAMGASAASAATATIGVNGGTSCTTGSFAMTNPGTTRINNALIGTVSCPSIPPFGGTANVRGADFMDVNLGTGGTGTIQPGSGGIGIEIWSGFAPFRVLACTVVITKNPINIVESPAGVWKPSPAITIPPDGTMTGSGCPTTPPAATIDLTLNV